MRSKITVLMPVYNRMHLVKHAIQSIIDQTYENWEFVIVDDGSNDGTWKILRDYQKKDKRIKPYRFQRHLGLVEALHYGNLKALGQIIVKQDSDDLSLPNRLEVIDRFFNKYPSTDFFYHAIYQTYEGTEEKLLRRIFIPALPIEKERILKEQYIPGAFAYTKKFSKEIQYRDLHCSEDWMLILDAYLKKKKIGFINEGLYECFLREDSNSLINENTGAYEEDEKRMKEILKEEYGIFNFKYAKR